MTIGRSLLKFVQFRGQLSVLLSTLALVSAPALALRAADTKVPEFSELYSVVRSNLAGATDEKLNQAAVTGFLAQLQSQVSLVTNAPARTNLGSSPLVTRTSTFDRGYGLIRIGRVDAGLPAGVKKAWADLSVTNQLKGLIIDLRYATGQDYPAAAATADLFFKTEQPLLIWGDSTVRSTGKTNAIDVPLVVLVNHETAGAAEALAAALRETEHTLLIGNSTAGQAHLFQEFPLQSGQTLRIASGTVLTGNGAPLRETGLEPDIRIAVRPEDEKGYFDDPYKLVARPSATAAKLPTDDLTGTTNATRNHRRLNEAELVRMQRDGMDLDAEPSTAGPGPSSGPVLSDPALARGLDLLKGLAFASKRR